MKFTGVDETKEYYRKRILIFVFQASTIGRENEHVIIHVRCTINTLSERKIKLQNKMFAL
ncbi:MAG: hypothetical protein ACLTE2_10080 [Eubacteriales bacterium]